MVDENKITLVQYPSNHSFVKGAKFVLVGDGEAWKNKFIHYINEYWPDEPVTIYYVKDIVTDLDGLSWLFNNINHSDYILCHIDKVNVNTDLEFVLTCLLINDEKTFLCYGKECPEQLVSMFDGFNKNGFFDDIMFEEYDGLKIIAMHLVKKWQRDSNNITTKS